MHHLDCFLPCTSHSCLIRNTLYFYTTKNNKTQIHLRIFSEVLFFFFTSYNRLTYWCLYQMEFLPTYPALMWPSWLTGCTEPIVYLSFPGGFFLFFFLLVCLFCLCLLNQCFFVSKLLRERGIAAIRVNHDRAATLHNVCFVCVHVVLWICS